MQNERRLPSASRTGGVQSADRRALAAQGTALGFAKISARPRHYAQNELAGF